MEKHQHPFDDFLKEALKGHQLVPREKARKAFLDEASTIIPARKGWNNWYYLPVLVVFISGLVAVFYFFINTEPVPSHDVKPETISSPIIIDTSSSTPTSSSLTENYPAAIASQKPAMVMTAAESRRTDIKPEESVISMNNTLEDKPETSVESQNPIQPVPFVQNYPIVNDVPDSTAITQGIEPDASSNAAAGTSEPAGAAVPVKDTIVPASPPQNVKPPEAIRVKPASSFTAAFCYLPELMFNTVEGSKFVNNFSIEGAFYRGLTSIRTGLGISVSQGITENAVQYNEFLGTYNKLDSITFIYNESEHDFFPNLHMSTEHVWDDTTRLDSTKVTKRYTYLQVPMVLGFDFWQRGRFTIGVRIGTIMSVMLSSKQLTGEYNAGENMVVGIDRISPEQVNINWQAIGGFNASVRLNRTFYLEVEPQARYYYQSIYEKSGMTEKPWSVGIRMAVTYKF